MENILDSKIFIVDDDLFNCRVYTKHLENLNFTNLFSFQSGVECLDKLVLKPEIILLDHQMEHINGFETLKKIKRFDPNIFTIIVSGQTDMNVAINSLKFGAFDYIIKGKNDTTKITSTLNRISRLKTKINSSKPSFIHRILKK